MELFCTYWLLFAVLCQVPVVSSSNASSVVGYIANNLHLAYTVEDNFQLDKPPTNFNPNTLALSNTGDKDIGADPWWIYFCHVRIVYDTYEKYPEGVPLGDSGLVVFHVNGCLHKIGPDLSGNISFVLKAGDTTKLTLYSEVWQVSRTDIMPNWYVTMENAQPQVLASTAGEALDFISDFSEPRQYKRTPEDRYEPYTAEMRFNIYGDIEDRGEAQHNVIPSPAEEDLNPEETVYIDGKWTVFTGEEMLKPEAEMLADLLQLDQMENSEPSSFFIKLNLSSVAGAPASTQEAYRLDITSNSVQITGQTADGVFWGIQSLLSLCDSVNCKIPVGSVLDYPRFPYRGMHLDVSRNFHPKEDVFRLLDVMSRYKLNKLHLHLTDDEGWRVEIEGLEELTEIGAHRCHDETETSCIMPQLGSGPSVDTRGSGFYTIEDYREILSYANERHVQVIPEVDMPGHAHAATKAMKFRYRKYLDMGQLLEASGFLLNDFNDTARYKSVQYFTDSAINPCLNSTYAFIEHVVRELKAMHEDIQPLEVFHFGGDEVPEGAWDGSRACQDLLKDKANGEDFDLMRYFVTRVASIVAEEGLNMAGWEDGLIGGGEPYELDELPSGSTYSTYSWNNIWEWGGGRQLYMMANAGYKAVISHATHFYFDHPYEPDPEERGYYWAPRFTDTRKAFSYVAEDVYANIGFDRMGAPLNRTEICSQHFCDPLDQNKRDNIIGIQGQLWSETVRDSSQLDYMIFPRLLAVAERAWHRGPWETDDENRAETTRADWERFANTLGYKELRRLDELGVQYAVPPPGATIEMSSDSYRLLANTAYPGLAIHYSLDGGKTWMAYDGNHQVPPSTIIQVVTKSADGKRSSRVVTLTSPPALAETTTPASGFRPLWNPLQCTVLALVLKMVLWAAQKTV